MPLPAPSFLGELGAAQVAELAAYATRLLGPAGAAVAVFGLLFIPSPNDVHVEGDVPEIPGLRYSWNRDESQLYLTYDDPDGQQRTFSAFLDGDVFRDEKGNVVGRVIGGNIIAIDAAAVSSDLVNQEQPKLCPAYAPDVAGSDQGKPYEENRARQYEDYIKAFINPPPDGPTPSGYVYYLPNATQGGKPVSFDDCQQATGILFEIKGEGIANLINDLPEVMAGRVIYQATQQIAASGGRPVVWIFAEEQAALFARKLFDNTLGLEGITVGYVPRTRNEMMPINYRYFVRGHWSGKPDEAPAITGAKFLKTLDALGDIDPLFGDWQFTGPWQIPEEHRLSFVPLAAARKRIEDIIESGVYIDDFNKPCPEYGHSVMAVAGARGPRHVAFAVSTNRQDFDLSFGEHNIASELSIVTYPLFKAALLAIVAAWNAQ